MPDIFNDLQDQALGRAPIFWIQDRINTEKSGVTWSIGKCGNGKGQPQFLAHLAIKSRAVAFTENYRQKIERWNIGVADFWNVPGHREMSQFGGKLLVNFA